MLPFGKFGVKLYRNTAVYKAGNERDEGRGWERRRMKWLKGWEKGTGKRKEWRLGRRKVGRGMSLGLGISDKKTIPRKTEYMEQMVISDGIPAVLWNRKLLEFLSEPFCGRGNNSEFRSMEQNRSKLENRFRKDDFSGTDKSFC
jgi:hypothetical protein